MKSTRFAAALALLFVTTATLPAARASQPPDPGSTAAHVTRLTTSLLGESQFSRHPLDAQLAGKLLERYLDALDGGRSLFLQSDASEFTAAYGKTLAEATRDGGDTRAAVAIFMRYRERLAQRVQYEEQLLRAGPFDFTGDDRMVFDREHAERPRDLTAARALWHQALRAEVLQEKLSDKPPSDIAATLIRRHQVRLRTVKATTAAEVVEVYLDALAHVYDPHSDYLGAEEMKSMSIAMNLSLVGVGASLGSEDGVCVVHDLVPGGPAARSGQMKPGDRIVGVGQGSAPTVDITDMPLTRIVELIRGPKGSPVSLKILPPAGSAGAARTVQIVREEVKLEDQEAKARVVELPRAGQPALRLGVIDLPSFYTRAEGDSGGATADVARLLARLKADGVAGVLLDLRRNGGGSLQEAIDLTGLFIRRGPVVQTRDAQNDVEVSSDRDPAVAYDGPLLVLTSRFSASASEILAGALQDYGRAVVAGDSATFGKGTVQAILPLAKVMDRMGLGYDRDPGALKVTIRKFYRPSGASTELRGVAADIVLPSSSEAAGISEAKLTDPLPWDTVAATPFDRLDRVAPYLATLRSASARRVAADPGFAEVRQKIASLQARLTAGSISLNEADRRREQTADKARDEAIAQAGKAAAAARPTYEITVQSASLATPPRAAVPPSPRVAGEASAKNGKGNLDLPGDELVMNEALSILSDYVGQTKPSVAPRPAAPPPVAQPQAHR